MSSTGGRGVIFAMKAVAVALVACVVTAEVVLRFLPVQSGLQALPVDARDPVARFTPNRPFVFSDGWRLSFANRGRVNNVGFINQQDYDSTETSPLMAIVGGDYVEAIMVPWDSTLQARLARQVTGRGRVYTFAGSGAALPQYLCWAEYARNTFHPKSLAVVIAGHDADHSLLKYWRDEGFYHFIEGDKGNLVVTRVDYQPSPLRLAIRHSALARYVIMNGQSLVAHQIGGVTGSMPPEPDEARVHDSERAVDLFLSELPTRAGLPPERIALMIDAVRPALYNPGQRVASESTYQGKMRRYLAEQGRKAGFEVIDMDTVFANRYARDSTHFEYPTSAQWNPIGHRAAAEAISSSRVFRDFRSLATGAPADSGTGRMQAGTR